MQMISFVFRALCFAFLGAVCSVKSYAEKFDIDDVVGSAMTQFNTPGLAVAVVKDDTVLYTKGFGYLDKETQSPVTPQSYFRIASLTKAFTAMTVAQLVQEESLNWNDSVSTHMPEFKMHDAYATENMTVLDLLTHRSGLGAGAGDSMLWPEPSGFSRAEIIHNLRYLTPIDSFRSQYAYSNTMYIVAAELVSKISQMPWTDRIKKTIFEPLDMACFAGDVPEQALKNSATPYGFSDERGLYAIPRNAIHSKGLASAAAGGIVCNLDGMTKWLQFWLSAYQTSSNTTVLSDSQVKTLWAPQTVIPISRLEREFNQTFLKAYALGWRVSNLYGHKLISHTGTLSGYQSYIAILPDLGVGAVVLNNGSNYGARTAIMQTILRKLVKQDEDRDWVNIYAEYQAERLADYLENYREPTGTNSSSLSTQQIVGTYESEWFGEVNITANRDELRFTSKKMPTLAGRLVPFSHTRWQVLWDNQNAAADALLHFTISNENQVINFTLTPFSIEYSEEHYWRDITFSKLTQKTAANE